MDDYTVENVMIGFTKDEIQSLIYSLNDAANSLTNNFEHRMSKKLEAVLSDSTEKWWETTESKTTDTGEQNADHT
jgi:hypothetical protein